MLTNKELKEMQEGVLKCFRGLCHNIVEITEFKVIENKEKFNCVLEGYVGQKNVKKRYTFEIESALKNGKRAITNIDIANI